MAIIFLILLYDWGELINFCLAITVKTYLHYPHNPSLNQKWFLIKCSLKKCCTKIFFNKKSWGVYWYSTLYLPWQLALQWLCSVITANQTCKGLKMSLLFIPIEVTAETAVKRMQWDLSNIQQTHSQCIPGVPHAGSRLNYGGVPGILA